LSGRKYVSALAEDHVSIVVNSYNPTADARMRAMTELALRSYRAFTGPAHDLILVEGHREVDAALAIVCEELGYQYLHLGRRLSFAQGYNAGLQTAKGPWRVLAATDVFVVQGWLEKLLTAAKTTNAWMISPYLSMSDYPAQQIRYPLSFRTFVPEFLTFNLNLMAPHCLEKVGFLDEQFSGSFNDVDYTLRIRQQGGEVAVVFCGEIMHLGRGTRGTSGANEVMRSRDLPAFHAKWPGIWDTRTCRLNHQRGLKKWLLAIERMLPARLSPLCLQLISRIEPLIAALPHKPVHRALNRIADR
jgi:GT2 family glycosyltransferase